MPRAKSSRGRPKSVSCPRCGKRFCTETNVLQHLNQPNGACYGRSLFHDHGSFDNLAATASGSVVARLPFHSSTELEPGQPAQSEDEPQAPRHSPELNADEDVDMDDLAFSDSLNGRGNSEGLQELRPGRLIETFKGCGETFPGGKTFMDEFKEDQYAAEREENMYYPWASKEEWAFASWLLRSRLSMSSIDSLLSLEIIKSASLSFRSAKELRTRAEILPPGPKWSCETLKPEYPVKQPLRLFYRNPLDCLQALLSNPLLSSHTISFVPRKIWTCAAKICRIYDEWLSGDRAWGIQEALPAGATILGVVLSSDKTNISVMSGNRLAHPVLISLANIDARIRTQTSLHAYLLLALLPIAKFTHKTTRVRGLLQDRLVHQALNIVLSPLKTAAAVGVMMSDPVGNLRYCFTPIASWISDTPEECLLAATSPKASPITTATAEHFGDPYRHPPRTATTTLNAIRTACSQCSPSDFKKFLEVCRRLCLNGVVEPFWMGWAQSSPSDFITIEPLHHFHRFAWDHDVKWCIDVVGADELDFRFSIIQTSVGYRGFSEGISKLKQVTGRDHRAVQRYIIGVVAGAVPRTFLVALRALLDFRYLAQAPAFTTQSLDRVALALQEFHQNKDAIVQYGPRDGWKIPKLELLQSVVPGIRQSGAAMQWTADITEHAHVEEIKVPARSGNNQNYYSQIARHLDRLDKCVRFDIATYIEERGLGGETADEGIEDNNEDEDHEPDVERLVSPEYTTPRRSIVDYFAVSSDLIQGSNRSVVRPFRTFATTTTAFHLATKPSLRLTVAEASTKYSLPDLDRAISAFFMQREANFVQSDQHRLQTWHKVRVQLPSYHDHEILEPPQTLRAIPPSSTDPFGQYDSVVVSSQSESDWPKRGLAGHSIVQLRMIFRLLHSDIFLAYVQRFVVGNVSAVTGMHHLKRAVRSNGQRVGEVIPLSLIRSPAHLIPDFGAEAHPRLTKSNSYEMSSEFWLNKYWSKEFYYTLSPL